MILFVYLILQHSEIVRGIRIRKIKIKIKNSAFFSVQMLLIFYKDPTGHVLTQCLGSDKILVASSFLPFAQVVQL